MTWIPVEERLPETSVIKRYRTKCIIGSMSPKEVEREVLFYSKSKKFASMDWVKITHWWDDEK